MVANGAILRVEPMSPEAGGRSAVRRRGPYDLPSHPTGDHPTGAGSPHRAGCEDGAVARYPGRGAEHG